MANSVSFVFVAQDLYSRVAERAARATNRIRTAAQRARQMIGRLGTAMASARAGAVAFGNSTRAAGLKLSLFATAPVLLLGRSMIKAASDAEETQSKFNTVFKSMEVGANVAADNLAKNFGLAGSEVRKLLGDTGDLLTGFGFSEKSAFDLSTKVSELAVDLASFTNFSGGAAGASAALTKALLGERESVKSLGISILEEDVKAKVALLTAQGRTFETKRQAKAFATLLIAQEQSTNAIGDFARTQGSAANQGRLLSARVQTLKEGFGAILLPIWVKITGVLIRLTDTFKDFSPTTKTVILVVLGLVAVLGPLLLVLGGIVLLLPAIATGFAIIMGPVGLVIGAVLLLIAGFILLKKNWVEVSNAIGGTIEQLGINFRGVFDGIGGTMEQLSINFQVFIDGIANFINGFINKIISVKDFLKGIFGFGGEDINVNKRSESIVRGAVQSRSDVAIKLRAPEGVVESIKQITTGKTPGLNVGVTMATAQ